MLHFFTHLFIIYVLSHKEGNEKMHLFLETNNLENKNII
jgi:hypothetical protein